VGIYRRSLCECNKMMMMIIMIMYKYGLLSSVRNHLFSYLTTPLQLHSLTALDIGLTKEDDLGRMGERNGRGI
jgi:hypothetical protein